VLLVNGLQDINNSYIRDDPGHGTQEGRVVCGNHEDAGNESLLRRFVGGEPGTGRIAGGENGDDHVAERKKGGTRDENLPPTNLVHEEQGDEAGDGCNGAVEATDKELLAFGVLQGRVDGGLVVLDERDARDHGRNPDERTDEEALAEGRGLGQVSPGEAPLSLELLCDVDVDEGELSSAPFIIRPVIMVASESLFGLLVPPFEAKPTG